MDKLYVTYTKKNKNTDEVYSGRTSGENTNSPEDADRIISARDKYHHKNKDGYEKANLDQESLDKDAIRGREQLLIEHFGGAKSEDGSSGNSRNSIARTNEKRDQYINAALKLFGIISLVLALIYITF
ncbi:MAG: hypothetical protein KA146_01560 [Leptospiraceae bacterium]|nr:hypothetical protein [Leptospiraceae bacterium]